MRSNNVVSHGTYKSNSKRFKREQDFASIISFLIDSCFKSTVSIKGDCFIDNDFIFRKLSRQSSSNYGQLSILKSPKFDGWVLINLIYSIELLVIFNRSNFLHLDYYKCA